MLARCKRNVNRYIQHEMPSVLPKKTVKTYNRQAVLFMNLKPSKSKSISISI